MKIFGIIELRSAIVLAEMIIAISITRQETRETGIKEAQIITTNGNHIFAYKYCTRAFSVRMLIVDAIRVVIFNCRAAA